MKLFKELKTIYHLSFAKKSGSTHEELLDSFYRPQAEDYDRFRMRLLPGRDAMMRALAPKEGIWVDIGGGTASNLEVIAEAIPNFERIFIVDLSSSLLERAKERIQKHGWKNITLMHADARNFNLPEGHLADFVTFSYSLTMIPGWYLAIENANKQLKDKGKIGVVDFTVHRDPDSPESMKSIVANGFWQSWFAWDRVYLNADHSPYLKCNFKEEASYSDFFSPPYLGLIPISVPYYWFIGQKNSQIC